MGTLKFAVMLLLFLLVLGLYLYPDMTRSLLDTLVSPGRTITGYIVSFVPN